MLNGRFAAWQWQGAWKMLAMMCLGLEQTGWAVEEHPSMDAADYEPYQEEAEEPLATEPIAHTGPSSLKVPLPAPTQAPAVPSEVEDFLHHSQDHAVLRMLDKITGRSQYVVATVGTTLHYGSLDLVVRSCVAADPAALDDRQGDRALIAIWDQGGQSAPATVKRFDGWMFSKSQGLMVLEHPWYDIVLQRCQ